jgi:hypothetical protein
MKEKESDINNEKKNFRRNELRNIKKNNTDFIINANVLDINYI